MRGLTAYHDNLFDARERALVRSMQATRATQGYVEKAAEDTARLLELDKVTKGPATRVAQTRLRNLQQTYERLGNDIASSVTKGVGDTVRDVSTSYQQSTDKLTAANKKRVDVAFSNVPDDALALFVARAGENGNTMLLSPNIWAAEQSQIIQLKVGAAIARGQSARDLAKDLEAHMLGGKGAGPGGSMRARAMRTARTEINVAYWESNALSAAQSNIVAGQRWNLSASHPRWDPCDVMAWNDSYDLGPGIYPAGSLPPRPHPNCFCWLEDVLRPVEEWGTKRDEPRRPAGIQIAHEGLPARMRGKIGGSKYWNPKQLARHVEGKPISERMHLTSRLVEGVGETVESLTFGAHDKAGPFLRALERAATLGSAAPLAPPVEPLAPPVVAPPVAPRGRRSVYASRREGNPRQGVGLGEDGEPRLISLSDRQKQRWKRVSTRAEDAGLAKASYLKPDFAVDPDVLEALDEAVYDAMSDMIEAYPTFAGFQVNELMYDSAGRAGRSMLAFADTKQHRADSRERLWFNLDFLGADLDDAAVIGNYATYVKASGEAGVRTVVRHEMAHHAEGIALRAMRDRTVSAAKTVNAGQAKALKLQEAWRKRRDDLAGKYAAGVSEYATTSGSEFVAEAVAVYTDPEYAGVLPSAVEEFVAELLSVTDGRTRASTQAGR
jgi:hypothetical protein